MRLFRGMISVPLFRVFLIICVSLPTEPTFVSAAIHMYFWIDFGAFLSGIQLPTFVSAAIHIYWGSGPTFVSAAIHIYWGSWPTFVSAAIHIYWGRDFGAFI